MAITDSAVQLVPMLSIQSNQKLNIMIRKQLTFLGYRVVWVLKELEPENWVHNGGTDFAVQLKPPSVSDVLGKVLTAEGTYEHWSLFNRFILANEILDAADSAGMPEHDFAFLLLTFVRAILHTSRDKVAFKGSGALGNLSTRMRFHVLAHALLWLRMRGEQAV